MSFRTSVRRQQAQVGGLRALASLDERHAERDSHRLMANQLKLSLPVPVSCLKGTAFPTLRLRDWMDFVINRNCWHVLCGLLRPDTDREQAILREFWHRFRQCHPDHEVFRLADSMQISLARTAPLLYHGDEGRGRRRTPFLVTSFHGLLGRGIRSGLQAQAKAGAPKEYTKLKPNFIGHSIPIGTCSVRCRKWHTRTTTSSLRSWKVPLLRPSTCGSLAFSTGTLVQDTGQSC